MKKNDQNRKPSSPLFEAAVRRDLGKVKDLLAAGRDPNEEDGPSGQRPLLGAASRGHLEIAQMLLQAGATVDATDTDGNTALWKAVFKYDDESHDRDVGVIDLLLTAGADPEKENKHGVSPRSLAATIASTRIKDVLERTIAQTRAKSSGKE